MGLFNFFQRKKIEKRSNNRAQNRPQNAPDFRTTSTAIIGQDATSFNCIDRIASQVAMLNFGIYSRRTRQKVQNHPYYALLRRPNLQETRFNFFYQSVVDYYDGGIFWLKGFGTGGQLVSLFRLNPSSVMIVRDPVTRARSYLYNGRSYTDDEVIFIPSRYSYNTLSGGLSIFQAAANAFDTAQKLDQYTKNSFANGMAGKRMVIDIANALPDATEEQIADLRNAYNASYNGVENAGRPLLKKKGIEYSTIDTGGTDNRSAELAENRKFQEHEMAKVFNVPDELLSGESAKVDLENIFTLFLEFAIKPIASQIQEAINLLLPEDYYFEFDFNGVMKVSLSKRIDAYQKQIDNGILSLNEARRMENRPPLPEAGDSFFMPANLMPWNDDIKNAYMAKQKQAAAELGNNATNDSSGAHSPAGDDKQ